MTASSPKKSFGPNRAEHDLARVLVVRPDADGPCANDVGGVARIVFVEDDLAVLIGHIFEQVV